MSPIPRSEIRSVRTGGRRRWRVGVGLLAAGLVLGAMAVFSGWGRTPTTPKTKLRLPAEARVGAIYIAAGPNDGEARLFRLLPSLEVTPIGGSRFFVSEISARGSRVVMAGADFGGSGFAFDHLYLVEGDRLRPVPGLGNPQAFSPVVESRDVIVYRRILAGTKGDYKDFEVVRWDSSARRETRIAYSRGPLDPAGSGPKGQVLLVKQSSEGRRQYLIWLGGRASHLQVPREVLEPGPAVTRWGAGGLIAFAWWPSDSVDPNAHVTFLVDPQTAGVVATLRGWSAIDWSPDGSMLLLARGPELGLARAPAFDSVQVVGRSPVGSVWNGVWAAP